jgi:hypothetical protein
VASGVEPNSLIFRISANDNISWLAAAAQKWPNTNRKQLRRNHRWHETGRSVSRVLPSGAWKASSDNLARALRGHLRQYWMHPPTGEQIPL